MQSTADSPEHYLQRTTGSYILLIRLPKKETIAIGKLLFRSFHRGYYAYVGSAMRGFKARLDHHLKENKNHHWHIDYLLQKASITSVIICQTEYRVECTIAQALKRQFDTIPGFGSSDCRCSSHLFFATNKKKMQSTIIANIKKLGIQPGLIKISNQ